MGALAVIESPLGRILIVIVAILAALATGGVLGVRYEQGQAAKDKLKVEQAAHERALARIEQDRVEQAVVATDLDQERDGRDADQHAFDKKLADASRGTSLIECNSTTDGDSRNKNPVRQAQGGSDAIRKTPSAQVQPDPESGGTSAGIRAGARFSATACQLWNDALRAGLTVAERAKWPAAGDTCPGGAPVAPH